MGCCGPVPISGEALVVKIFSDTNFKLKNFYYNKLLNRLSDFIIYQELYKKYIEEQLIPLFYNQNSYYDNKIYHKALFNKILSYLEEKNSIYEVMIYLYPFIDHMNENVEEHLYSIFNYIGKKGQLNLRTLLSLFEKYIKFVTIDVTNLVAENMENDEQKMSVLELNKIYTEDNVKNYIATNLFNMLKIYGQNDIITQEIFIDHFKHINIANFDEIRNSIYVENFGKK